MPSSVAPSLSGDEIKARQDAARDAIASARLEGLEVSAEAREIMELYSYGRITEAEVIERIRQLHLRRDDDAR